MLLQIRTLLRIRYNISYFLYPTIYIIHGSKKQSSKLSVARYLSFGPLHISCQDPDFDRSCFFDFPQMPGFRASRYVDAGGLASFKPKRRIGPVSSIFPGFQGFVLAVTSSKLAGFGFFLAKTTGFPRNPVNIIPSRRILFWRILFASTRTFSYSLLHI